MNLPEYQKTVFELLGFTPNPIQKPIFDSTARIILVAGGWRSGKTTIGAVKSCIHAPMAKLVWVVGPNYLVARDAFREVLDLLNKMHLLAGKPSDPEQGPCSLETINGCRIETKSAIEPEKLGMKAPDFIWVDEAAQLTYDAYLWLRGRIAEKRSPLLMTGTFEGSIGWYPEFFTRWQAPNEQDAQSFSLPTWSNTAKFPGGREDSEIKSVEAETPHDTFLERYGGVPCKPSGLILSEFSNLIHVGKYPYDPEVSVEIAVDPGAGVPGAYAALAIQVKEGAVYLIAEKYLQGYITEDIILSCKKDWLFFGKISSGAVDIAGAQRHGMPPVVQQWQSHRIKLNYKYIPVKDSIDVLRTFLKVHPETGRPNLYVDYSCKGFISECGGGKSPVHGGGPWLYDLNTGKPEEKNCHATKAVAYYLVNTFGYTPSDRGESVYGKIFTPSRTGRMLIVRR